VSYKSLLITCFYGSFSITIHSVHLQANRGESIHEDATQSDDILQSETLPIYQEDSGELGLAEENGKNSSPKNKAQTPPAGQIPAPNNRRIADEIRDPSPGTSGGIVRRSPELVLEQQSTSRILANNQIDNGGWDPLINTADVTEEIKNTSDDRTVLQSMMIKGVRNLLENLKKVTLQDGSKVTLGIDWAKVFVPRKGKGKIVTAAMKKGRPVCDLRNVLEQSYGLDPSVMPTNPEGAHLTPPSPLDQVPAWGQSQADETERRLRLLTEACPAEPDSTHCEEVLETKKQAEDRIQWWIGRARNQKQKPSPQDRNMSTRSLKR
jgi:hypothetical protein